MYHVSKPVELFELMIGVGAQVIVIETTVVPAPFSLFMMRRENLKSPGAAVDYAQVLVPTRKAVIELANQFGFDAVPLAPNITRPYADVEDYREQRRLAFICSKSLPLESLSRETSPPFLPWRVAPLLAREMRRRAKRRSKARQRAQVPA
jgi:hypothetical protein